jgi:hypothetical protein
LHQIKKALKKLLAVILFLGVFKSNAQQIDSVYVNLYTDSLKKGTYNYINVDGLLDNGRFMPLDTNHVIFKSSHGKFYGNSLWIDTNINVAKVDIQLILKKDNRVIKNLEMYIRTKEEETLKTEEELLNEMKQQRKSRKNKA